MDAVKLMQSWPSDLRDEFMRLGTPKTHAAGDKLPDAAVGFSGMRLIERGRVQVLAKVNDEEVPVHEYGPGELLGVCAILAPESAPDLSWLASQDVSLIEFEASGVQPMLAKAPEVRQLLEHAAHLSKLDVLIATDPLFQMLPEDRRRALFGKTTITKLAPGEKLIRQGEFNYHLYLLMRGSVRIVMDGEDISRLQAGGVVGEISTSGLSAPIADVIAEEWTEALAFPIEDVADAAIEYPEFAEKLREIGTQRMYRDFAPGPRN